MSGPRSVRSRRPAAWPPALQVVSPTERAEVSVRSKGQSRHANSLLILIGLGVTSAVVFGLVLVNIALLQSSFELGDVQAKMSEERSRQQQLRFEVAKAESPDRIALIGAQLGLVAPERQEFLQSPAVLVSKSKPGGSLDRGRPRGRP